MRAAINKEQWPKIDSLQDPECKKITAKKELTALRAYQRDLYIAKVGSSEYFGATNACSKHTRQIAGK